MCYAPTRRSTQLIKRASQRIDEGKFEEAERLLSAARCEMGQVIHVVWQGKRVGDWYSEASKALLQAKLKAKRGVEGR